MTEAEWQASEDPATMLDYVRVRAGQRPSSTKHSEQMRIARGGSDRKLRLFAVAAWRNRVSRLRTGPGRARSLSVASIAEQFADGEPPPADRPRPALGGIGDEFAPLLPVASEAAWSMIRTDQPEEARQQAHLLRDIVGNPFRPATLVGEVPDGYLGNAVWVRREWLTPTVVSLAHAAYDSRDPDTGHLDPVRLAVLADALEEAGCDSEPLLRHLRGWRRCRACAREGGRHAHACVCKPTGGWLPNESPHVRGCWAIDLLTGRE